MAWVWYTWEGYPNPAETRQSITEKFGAFWLNIQKDTKALRVGFSSDEDCSNGKRIKRSDSHMIIPEKAWTHVAATYDHNTRSIEIYINGTRSGTSELSSLCNDPINVHPITIGGRYANKTVCKNCPDGFFNGYIDDMRYYSIALTQSQINTLRGPGKSNIIGVTCSECKDEREVELDICNVWKAAQSGGFGTTVDNWDISKIPTRSIFDIRFEAYSLPDKFIIEYPPGTTVHNTGWRGSSSYDGNPKYPGGIAGPGRGQVDNLFTKQSTNSFKVTVVGGEPGTAWDYEIRCRTP